MRETSYRELQDQLGCPADEEPETDGCGTLELVNLAASGATTSGLISNQLPEAAALLQDRDPDDPPVAVVTVHIGGNDVVGPILEACLGGADHACLAAVDREFSQYEEDLDTALHELRAAAGSDTPVMAGTYDNPLPACEIGRAPGADVLGPMLLEGWDAVPGGPIERV